MQYKDHDGLSAKYTIGREQYDSNVRGRVNLLCLPSLNLSIPSFLYGSFRLPKRTSIVVFDLYSPRSLGACLETPEALPNTFRCRWSRVGR